MLPGGGGGVGSFGGGSGEGVSLNLKKYKRLKSSVTLHASKTAKHRNYVHCRIRDCMLGSDKYSLIFGGVSGVGW